MTTQASKGGLVVSNACYVNHIDIDDGHSTGVLAIVCDILGIANGACTSFNASFSNYKISFTFNDDCTKRGVEFSGFDSNQIEITEDGVILEKEGVTSVNTNVTVTPTSNPDLAVSVGVQYEAQSWMAEAASEHSISVADIKRACVDYGDVVKNALEGTSYMLLDGASYFNTNTLHTTTSSYEVLAMPTVNNGDHPCLFGADTASSNADSIGVYLKINSNATLTFGNSNKSPFGKAVLERLYKIKLTASTFYYSMNGTAYTSYSNSSTKANGNYPIYIGAKDRAGSVADSMFYGRLYYFKIFASDGTLAHFWIPVANNKMYDFVTRTTLDNQGTGTATINND